MDEVCRGVGEMDEVVKQSQGELESTRLYYSSVCDRRVMIVVCMRIVTSLHMKLKGITEIRM